MAYTLISDQVLGSAAASVTFSSIPGTYKDLVVEMVAGANSTNSDGTITFNGDTGTNYSRTYVLGNGTAASSGRDSTTNGIHALWTDASGMFTEQIHVMSYANTSVYKTVLARESGAGWAADAVVGLWRSTAAVTSISLTTQAGTFPTGSTFRLWGVS